MEIKAATLSLYVSDILNQTRSYLGCLEVFEVDDETDDIKWQIDINRH